MRQAQEFLADKFQAMDNDIKNLSSIRVLPYQRQLINTKKTQNLISKPNFDQKSSKIIKHKGYEENVLQRYLFERGYYQKVSQKLIQQKSNPQLLNAQDQTQSQKLIKNEVKSKQKPTSYKTQQVQSFPEINSKIRFYKPYLENSKFVDLLYQNRRIIRKGLFDMPAQNLSNSFNRFKQKNGSNNRIFTKVQQKNSYLHFNGESTKNKLRKDLILIKKKQKTKRFKQTIDQYQKQFENISSQDEKNPRKRQSLINRVLAIEMIKQRVPRLSLSLTKTSNQV